MRSFYINPETGDIELDGSNNIKMVEDDAELVQSARITIATNVGEWFLNESFGFDRTAIQGKRVNYELVTDLLYAAILEDERIDSIQELNFDFDSQTRTLTVEFELVKADGEVVEGRVTV